jgi:glycosyltransferase involved in cell wall biosynthesis
MNICLIGKYPPIQGGVSAQTYWTARALAEKGHHVHVVTNAKESRLPYRVLMRAEDWSQCQGQFGSGSVTVHWTEASRKQWHIPMSPAFVSRLSSLAIDVVDKYEIDLLFSWYTEPYSVAAKIVKDKSGLAWVAKTAGSDVGRLWQQPELASLYDCIFKTADAVICGGPVAEMMKAKGVDEGRLFTKQGAARISDLIKPEGPQLDVEGVFQLARSDPRMASLLYGEYIPDRPYIGVYGKLGEAKGTYALMRALQVLKNENRDFGLLLMGHASPWNADNLRAYWESLGLEDRIVQIPFLPHWRVPEFLRKCLAVCCLEQDFPIVFHTPVIAKEVLASGTCLVGSTEVLHKARSNSLIDGFNCLAVRNVNDIDQLSGALRSVLNSPSNAQTVGRRGLRVSNDLNKHGNFPSALEHVFSYALSNPSSKGRIASPRKSIQSGRRDEPQEQSLGLGELTPAESADCVEALNQLNLDGRAGKVVERFKRQILDAQTIKKIDRSPSQQEELLFRFRNGQRNLLGSEDWDSLVPIVKKSIKAVQDGDHQSPMTVLMDMDGVAPPLLLRGGAAGLLALCDGRHTVGQIRTLRGNAGESAEDIDVGLQFLFERAALDLLDRPVSTSAEQRSVALVS